MPVQKFVCVCVCCKRLAFRTDLGPSKTYSVITRGLFIGSRVAEVSS
jgi:hypothetical protein